MPDEPTTASTKDIKPPHLREKEDAQSSTPDLMSMEFDESKPVLNDVLTLQEQDQFLHQLRRAVAQKITVVQVDRRIIEHYCGTDYKGLYFDMSGIRLYEKGKMEQAIELDERRVEGFGSPSNT